MTIPSVARNVHYVSLSGVCLAAIVRAVDQHQGTIGAGGELVGHVDLCVFDPSGPLYEYRVHQDELPPPDKIVAGERATHKPGTWHWPERV